MKAPGYLVAALIFSLAPVFAQAPENPVPQVPTFRSGADLVALNVAVFDGTRYVQGLQSADFAVYEDGVKQDVRFFETSGVPIDLIMLVDTSSSMTDKMGVVHDAAIGFLKTLRDGDRGAVVAFADGVNVLQPLTPDRALLEKAVMSTRAHGATALNNALYVALKQFGQAQRPDGAVRRQAIAVLSDGEDTCSLVTFDDVLALARRTGVNIYTVRLQSRNATPAEEHHRYFSESDFAMKTLARETGAQSFFPAQITDLKGTYAAIAGDLASQYSIGYVPMNARLDGRFRRVVVQIVSRPALRARTRMGYTASDSSSSSSALASNR